MSAWTVALVSASVYLLDFFLVRKATGRGGDEGGPLEGSRPETFRGLPNGKEGYPEILTSFPSPLPPPHHPSAELDYTERVWQEWGENFPSSLNGREKEERNSSDLVGGKKKK